MLGWSPACDPWALHRAVFNQIAVLSLQNCGPWMSSLMLTGKGECSTRDSDYCSSSESASLTSPGGWGKPHYPANRFVFYFHCFLKLFTQSSPFQGGLPWCLFHTAAWQPARPQNSFHPIQLFLLSIALASASCNCSFWPDNASSMRAGTALMCPRWVALSTCSTFIFLMTGSVFGCHCCIHEKLLLRVGWGWRYRDWAKRKTDSWTWTTAWWLLEEEGV